MPWKPRDGGHTVAVKVEDMLMLVDSMLENTSAEEDKVPPCATTCYLLMVV